MRRLFSITLLLLLTLPLLASFATQGAEARLPACCRRGGAHHCMMGMDSSSGPAMRQRCASFPQAAVLATHVQDWGFGVLGLKLAEIVAQSAPVVLLQTYAPSVFGGARWTRGPPSFTLLQFGATCFLVVRCLIWAGFGGFKREHLSVS